MDKAGVAEKDEHSTRTDMFNFSPHAPCFIGYLAAARLAAAALLSAGIVFHAPASDAIQEWYSRAREVPSPAPPRGVRFGAGYVSHSESLLTINRATVLLADGVPQARFLRAGDCFSRLRVVGPKPTI